jgi:hypothetical protein
MVRPVGVAAVLAPSVIIDAGIRERRRRVGSLTDSHAASQ